MNDISMPAQVREDFRFTGRGGEYFRIWIVNLLLSVVTLGIYSAWAKVRREQYFHRHTVFGGTSLDYHGRPSSILKGRLLVVGLLAVYQGLAVALPVAAALLFLVSLVLWPWIMRQSLRFRAHNTSWRGIRLHFDGTLGEVARIFYLHGLAVPLSLGLAYPWWKRNLQRFALGRMRFGQTPFTANPSASDYYLAYLIPGAIMFVIGLLLVAGLGIAISVFQISWPTSQASTDGVPILMSLMIAVVYLMMMLLGPAISRALTTNALFNAAKVGPHRFVSTMRPLPLMGIILSNALLTLVTLGFYMPFAKVRLARYRAQCTALIVDGSLDEFLAEEALDVRALGDEAADFLDVDIGF
ncbi:MAG: YjgN family protein [Rhodocyclaceae bacterium]